MKFSNSYLRNAIKIVPMIATGIYFFEARYKLAFSYFCEEARPLLGMSLEKLFVCEPIVFIVELTLLFLLPLVVLALLDLLARPIRRKAEKAVIMKNPFYD